MEEENMGVGSLIGDLIDEEAAAKLLGRSRQWLRNLRLEGEGPMYVDLGNSVAYYPNDVQEWLQSRRKAPKKVSRKPRPKKAAPKKVATAPKATTKE